MSIYCGNCGAPNEQDAVFCCNCGTPMSGTAAVPQASPKAHSNDPWLKQHKLAIVVPLVLLVLVMAWILLPRGYEKPINQFVEGLNEGNAQMIAMSMIQGTDIEGEVLAELRDEDDMDDFMDDIYDLVEDSMNVDADDMDLEFSCKIAQKAECKNVDAWQKEHNSSDMYDQKKVDKVYMLDVDLTTSFHSEYLSGSITQRINNFYAVKYNGKWTICLDDTHVAW